jgi:geranylgeranyl diphosphate synthase, type II
MFDLKSYLEEKKKEINKTLYEILHKSYVKTPLVKAMDYSLMAGGKRIRPILCIAAAEAVGHNRGKDILTAGCAIEMIHTYSLIHDDLPAMDDDALRRGRETCHVAFGEATAILAGDALLTLAFEVISCEGQKHGNDALKWLKVMHIISAACGYKGMIRGQMQDIKAEPGESGLVELEKMHGLKTGAIIEACLRTGAVLGNASCSEIEELGTYAKYIGLAFQVADDILNVEGDPVLMGKAVGTDENLNKSTYPGLIGLRRSKAFAKELVIKGLQSLNNFDKRAEPLRTIANYIIERKK